jgi:hypothetical protein
MRHYLINNRRCVAVALLQSTIMMHMKNLWANVNEMEEETEERLRERRIKAD